MPSGNTISEVPIGKGLESRCKVEKVEQQSCCPLRDFNTKKQYKREYWKIMKKNFGLLQQI